MSKQVLVVALLIVGMLIGTGVSAQIDQDKYNWTLKRDRGGVKVYTSKVAGSRFKAVSATMVVDTRVDSLAALTMDLERCSEWAVLCEKAYIYERVSATECYVYSRNDLPFPVRDRDAVSHVIWSRDATSGVISMTSRAVSGKMDKVKGAIRLKKAHAQWRFTPQEDGKVLVENFAHIEPNGPVPAWLVNRLILGSPYKTMKNMRRLIQAGDYDDAQLDF